MKQTLILMSLLGICHHLISMDAATALYYQERLKNEPLGYLPNWGTVDMRRWVIDDARDKYDRLTTGWTSRCSSPLKPFESCTWNDIQAAWNGDNGKLTNSTLINSAKY